MTDEVGASTPWEHDYPVEVWTPIGELDREAYSPYWNDVEEERAKEWWVADGDFSKMEEYLDGCRLLEQVDRAAKVAGSLGRPIRGQGADLAAGTLWAVPRLLAAGAERVYALEYSRHRLLVLGPLVLRHYGVRRDAVVLCQGSFYDLRVPDGSLDFVFTAQGFHHAADPQALLREIRRVIRPAGVVLITGEHVIDPTRRVRNAVASLLAHTPKRLQQAAAGHTLATRPVWIRRERPPTDPVLGDHYYFRSEYRAMFAQAGFRSHLIHEPDWPFQAFVLSPSPSA